MDGPAMSLVPGLLVPAVSNILIPTGSTAKKFGDIWCKIIVNKFIIYTILIIIYS